MQWGERHYTSMAGQKNVAQTFYSAHTSESKHSSMIQWTIIMSLWLVKDSKKRLLEGRLGDQDE